MVTYTHKRGNRATGWSIPHWPPKGQLPIRVRGDGTFKVPVSAPKQIHKLIQESGHRRVTKSGPKKEVKPEPKKERKLTPEWYPEELANISGVGKSTVKAVGEKYKHPTEILETYETGTRPGGQIGKVWLKIVDFIKSKNTSK